MITTSLLVVSALAAFSADRIKVGDQVTVMKLDGSQKNFRVTKLFGFFGLQRLEIQEAKAGDLIAVSGMDDIFVGETVCPVDHPEALPLA